jgi:Ca-activated chloride channel family protein
MPFRSTALLGALALVAILGGALTTWAAEKAPTVMFLLDGSGSMWGKLGSDQRVKFEFTREALRDALPRIRPDARTGLAAFGHRRRGYCADAQVIVPPEAGNPEQMATPLEKMNATGKGPLVLGLRQAADAIGVAAPASIILMHDDIDNCGQDVCTAAAEIAKANPRLKIHTISIGLDDAKLQHMSCVARLTGGKLYNAQDATGVVSALNQIIKLAHLDIESEGQVANETAEEQPEPEGPAKPDAGAPPGLYLSAGLGERSATLESPVLWRVAKADDGTLVSETRAASLAEKLPSGTYDVEARLGLASARQSVNVDADTATAVRLNLDAGVLKMLARPAKAAPALPDAVFSVTPVADGEDGAAARPLWIGREAQPELVLPAGSYKVVAESGNARQEQTVTIEPATGTTFDATLATGRLELSATRASAGEQGEPMTDGVTFIVYEDDPEAPQGRREVTRSAAASPAFTLPAGTYYVTARTPGAEAREQIAIGAGDIVRRTLPLALARLTLSATLDGQPAPETLPLSFAVTRLDPQPQELVRTVARDVQLELSAGRYRLEATLGTTNVKAATEVALRAGQAQQATLDLKAGEITLVQAGAGGSDVFWEIKDGNRHTVLRTSRSQPTALLAPGQYVVTSETRERELRGVLVVKAGERRTFEIGG